MKGTLTITGRYPSLAGVGRRAFYYIRTAESKVEIACSSPAGLKFGTDPFKDFKGNHVDSNEQTPCTAITDATASTEVLVADVSGTTLADSAFWAVKCQPIPATASFIKVVMGTAVDYFRPVEGATYCEMLTSYSKHQYSKDGVDWITPAYSRQTIVHGGSSFNFPTTKFKGDERYHLSFWGTDSGLVGGCCSTSPTLPVTEPSLPENAGGAGGKSWGQSFTMWYGTVTTTPTTTAEITSSTIATTTTTTTARICKNGGQPLTPALYEQGPDAYANVTCIPKNAFAKYTEDVTLNGLDFLAEIESYAFYYMEGTLTIIGRYPSLSNIRSYALWNAGPAASSVSIDCSSPDGLTISHSAFDNFKGPRDRSNLQTPCTTATTLTEITATTATTTTTTTTTTTPTTTAVDAKEIDQTVDDQVTTTATATATTAIKTDASVDLNLIAAAIAALNTSAQGLLEGGFTPTQLIDAGYTKSDLIAAGLDEAVADAAVAASVDADSTPPQPDIGGIPDTKDGKGTVIGGTLAGFVVLLAIIGLAIYLRKNKETTNNNNADERTRAAAAATVQNRAFGIDNRNMQATYGEAQSRAELDATGSHVQQAYGEVQTAETIDYATIDEAGGGGKGNALEDPDYLQPDLNQPAVYDGISEA